MPDLFLGAAAGPPGLPDWIDHAFPDPVKNDPDYLATAVAALGALFFQDSVLAELRPLATDPPGEAARRLAMVFRKAAPRCAFSPGRSPLTRRFHTPRKRTTNSLFFHDSILPELRPLATDPPGEAARRLARVFRKAAPRCAFFHKAEARLRGASTPRASGRQTHLNNLSPLTQEPKNLPHLYPQIPDLFLGAAAGPHGLPDWIDHASPDPVKHGPVYLHPQVPSKTQKVRSYFQPVTGAGRTATCGT